MFVKHVIPALLLFTTSVFSERIAIDTTLTNTLTRHAWFASAAYSSDCNIPPFNTIIEKDFSDFTTDTQVRLFRDDAAEEYILAFRGTSSIIDVITDFRSSLVDCTPALPLCANCTVSLYLRDNLPATEPCFDKLDRYSAMKDFSASTSPCRTTSFHISQPSFKTLHTHLRLPVIAWYVKNYIS